jgi:hypothetical protein
LAGVDLNRQWRRPSRISHPTIYYTKAMMRTEKALNDVILYVDLHGHSRKKNIFMYGCDDKKRPRPQVRMLPKILSWHPRSRNLVNYEDCTFHVKRGREATARVVVARELNIRNSYTLEATFCGADYGPLRDMHFSMYHLMECGAALCEAVLDFCIPSSDTRTQLLNSVAEQTPAAPHGDRRRGGGGQQKSRGPKGNNNCARRSASSSKLSSRVSIVTSSDDDGGASNKTKPLSADDAVPRSFAGPVEPKKGASGSFGCRGGNASSRNAKRHDQSRSGVDLVVALPAKTKFTGGAGGRQQHDLALAGPMSLEERVLLGSKTCTSKEQPHSHRHSSKIVLTNVGGGDYVVDSPVPDKVDVPISPNVMPSSEGGHGGGITFCSGSGGEGGTSFTGSGSSFPGIGSPTYGDKKGEAKEHHLHRAAPGSDAGGGGASSRSTSAPGPMTAVRNGGGFGGNAVVSPPRGTSGAGPGRGTSSASSRGVSGLAMSMSPTHASSTTATMHSAPANTQQTTLPLL